LRSGVDGPNALYLYGPGGFPTQSNASSNYWVDVLFSTGGSPAGGPITLSDRTVANGLATPLLGMYAHAAAFGDVNGDGWDDLFVGTFADYPEANYQVRGASGPSPDRLLLGGPSGFTPDSTFPTMYARTSGAAFADLDGDGDLDLVITRHRLPDRPRGDAPTVVLRNDAGRFVPGPALVPVRQGRGIGVFDYDGDGRLDLFLADDWYDGGGSLLLKNRGGLVFDDVTAAAGLSGVLGFGVSFSDLNADGWPDIAVTGTTPVNGPGSSAALRLLINNRNGSFREAPNSVFTWDTYGNSDDVTGIAVRDLNRDGRPDIVLGHHFASTLDQGRRVPIRAYLHSGLDTSGNPTFRDVTVDSGLPALATKSSHVELVDMDNDGWPDIVTTASAAGGSRPAVFRNTGAVDGVPRFAAADGLGSPQYWPTGATADVDRDGRVDVLVVDFDPNRPSLFFHNDTAGGHWLEITVATPHRGVGARVEVFAAGHLGSSAHRIDDAEVAVAAGYAGGVPARVHVGLGALSSVDVRVTLPRGGGVIELRNVLVDRRLDVVP
jgi:hypothetical protein